jgi:hypothetical protein
MISFCTATTSATLHAIALAPPSARSGRISASAPACSLIHSLISKPLAAPAVVFFS